MWKESKKARLQKITPLIVAYLKTTESHQELALYIENIGDGLANNVKFKVVRDCIRFGKKEMKFSEIDIVKNGVNVFPPNYKFQFYIGYPPEIFKNYRNESIEIEISYFDIKNRKIISNYKLEFNQALSTNYSKPPETYTGQIAYYLSKISKKIENQ